MSSVLVFLQKKLDQEGEIDQDMLFFPSQPCGSNNWKGYYLDSLYLSLH